ncbi:MAG: zinc-ribbon domain-containing protein [Haloferacaceae archaeon]
MGFFQSLGRRVETVKQSLSTDDCPSCGAALDDDDRTCQRCGADVTG